MTPDPVGLPREPKRMRVDVTQSDIERGRRVSATRCPLARAIRRSTPLRPVAVFNDSWQASWDIPEIPLSRAASRFANRFDRGEPVEPATFYLRVPR